MKRFLTEIDLVELLRSASSSHVIGQLRALFAPRKTTVLYLQSSRMVSPCVLS
jgi:hypothetical protein